MFDPSNNDPTTANINNSTDPVNPNPTPNPNPQPEPVPEPVTPPHSSSTGTSNYSSHPTSARTRP